MAVQTRIADCVQRAAINNKTLQHEQQIANYEDAGASNSLHGKQQQIAYCTACRNESQLYRVQWVNGRLHYSAALQQQHMHTVYVVASSKL